MAHGDDDAGHGDAERGIGFANGSGTVKEANSDWCCLNVGNIWRGWRLSFRSMQPLLVGDREGSGAAVVIFRRTLCVRQRHAR